MGKIPLVLFLLVLLVGLTLLGRGLFDLGDTIAFLARAEQTEARFVGAVARSGGNHGGTFLHPTFQFTTRDGRVMTFTSPSGSTAQPYADGEPVRIAYDPQRPGDARLLSFLTLWIAPTLLCAAGLLLSGGAVLVRAALARQRRRA
ncbi:hypothetical protein XH98_12165 [Bradyrhizobium sp. CCBAU 51745]|uniref:DUF3592 domain-containing protein n=1 Tax=Bradyrhizobium sp. CCBAU 51745 TaxID=1325099 RepID=UPI002304E313|nr:DUF3592 domain-containing protein [Bradyrhizobium sp. CCBAU 51745]MDA9439870.1 hypothetical protein [Bradyrhizobium sp. CCBAU 51745]